MMGVFHFNATRGSVLTKAGRWKLVKAASVRLFLSVAVHVLSSLPSHNFPTDPAWLLLVALIPKHAAVADTYVHTALVNKHAGFEAASGGHFHYFFQ
jgi:hypothetical protein